MNNQNRDGISADWLLLSKSIIELTASEIDSTTTNGFNDVPFFVT